MLYQGKFSKLLGSNSHVKGGFPDSSVDKEFFCHEGDLGSIPGLERSSGEGKGYPLQYFGLENSMDSLGITKSQTQLSDSLQTSLGFFPSTFSYFPSIFPSIPICNLFPMDPGSTALIFLFYCSQITNTFYVEKICSPLSWHSSFSKSMHPLSLFSLFLCFLLFTLALIGALAWHAIP